MTGHSHRHRHHHGATENIRVAFLLNFGFALLEIVGGLLTNSIAILSDALHDLGDSLSIGLSWLLNRYSERTGDAQFSYGYRRFALVGALLNGLILIVGAAFVLSQAIQRLSEPEPIVPGGVVALAIVGIAVNGYAALRLHRTESLNARVISWHLVEDVLGWCAILLLGVVSLVAEVPVLDPLISIGISVLIIVNGVRQLVPVIRVFLQAAPPGVDLESLQMELDAIDGVESVHDLRVWSLDGEHHVLTAHLVISERSTVEQQQRILELAHAVARKIHLQEAAIQIDLGCDGCASAVTQAQARIV